MAEPECLFCRIISGAIPAKKVHEDPQALVFEDIRPQAPVHWLLIPKRHLRGLAEAAPADAALLGELQLLAARLARQHGITGYRTVLNVGADAGQSVFHLHLHLLGGRPLAWPPG